MNVFTDRAGRTWEVTLNVSKAKLVKDRIKFDLLDLRKSNTEKLINDIYILVDILWVLCESQADKIQWEEKGIKKTGVSDVEFGEGLAGDTIDKATEALLNEVSDFLPNHRQRKIYSKGLEKMNEAMDITFEKLDKALDNPILMDKARKEVDQMITQELHRGK